MEEEKNIKIDTQNNNGFLSILFIAILLSIAIASIYVIFSMLGSPNVVTYQVPPREFRNTTVDNNHNFVLLDIPILSSFSLNVTTMLQKKSKSANKKENNKLQR